MTTQQDAISYEEPDIVTVLIISSLLLALNGFEYLFDKLVYCGLVSQIFVGMAFGTPGLQWLSDSMEHMIVQLGYLGLLLLVFEGGLSTNISVLKPNLFLSSVIAITGVTAPIGLSFVLQPMLGITSLQAFAAGAALCSTSLGTTFTVLRTSGLSRSKLGVVLAGAAMIDDLVGLVFVQIISSLGTSTQISAAVIVRPVCVSVAYALIVPLVCHFLIRPVIGRLDSWLRQPRTRTWLSRRATTYWLHTGLLVGFVTSASYAGTSNLFAAYLAGACISWWEAASSEVVPPQSSIREGGGGKGQADAIQQPPIQLRPQSVDRESENGVAVFEHYYGAVTGRILRPFFFASIGFSIPIREMFDGRLVWQGIIYALFMVVGKIVCGLWLVQLSVALPLSSIRRLVSSTTTIRSFFRHRQATPAAATELTTSPSQSNTAERVPKSSNCISKPQSLYPAAILGTAMVSRGEIGFLVSAIAQSNGLYSSSTASSNLFLVVTWAIMLCTILGPLATGLLTKRVWKLQEIERNRQTGRQDPLGVWGVESMS